MDLASPVSAAASVRSGAIARAWIRVAGFAILGLAFVYLGWFLQEHWTALTRFQWSRVRWPLLPVAAVLYGSSLVTTALAWPAILEALGRKIGTRQALAIGLTAQVGKYVPGNVAHYVGRAALAKRAAISFRQSGLSTAIEFSSAVIAGLLVAGASLIGSRALGLKLLGQVDGSQLTAVIAVMLALVTALIIAATRTPRLAFMLSQWSRPVRWLIASFLLAGSSMVVLLFALGATPGISPLLPVGFYALAWIAGFVVPGAPAGLGVREAVLIGTLSALVGNPMAIIAAAAHRLLSAIVDGIAALAGFALLTRSSISDRTEA